MSTVPTCVLDANVLYPAQLRDLLMRLGVAGLFRAHWTDEIHDEWTRSVLTDHPDIEQEAIERTRRLMERALPAAQVTGFERHIEGIKLPDPDDRHVVAAAVEAEADYVVTFNLRDFPRRALEPLAIQATHPDAFVADLASQRLGDVLDIMRRHRASLRKPPRSRAEYVNLLRRAGLEQTSRLLAEQRGDV